MPVSHVWFLLSLLVHKYELQRPDLCPSEYVTAVDLRNTLVEFPTDNSEDLILKKFPMDRVDYERLEGMRLVA